MKENISEDFADTIVRGCVVCGTLETEMDDGPVTEEVTEIDGLELDAEHERVFCSEDCKEAYDGV